MVNQEQILENAAFFKTMAQRFKYVIHPVSNHEIISDWDPETGLKRITLEHYISRKLDLAVQVYQP